MVRISNYWDVEDGMVESPTFAITPAATAGGPPVRAASANVALMPRGDGTVVLSGAPAEGVLVEVYSVNGRVTYRRMVRSPHTDIYGPGSAAGVRIVRLRFGDGSTRTQVLSAGIR
jgi:hypothetical protein